MTARRWRFTINWGVNHQPPSWGSRLPVEGRRATLFSAIQRGNGQCNQNRQCFCTACALRAHCIKTPLHATSVVLSSCHWYNVPPIPTPLASVVRTISPSGRGTAWHVGNRLNPTFGTCLLFHNRVFEPHDVSVCKRRWSTLVLMWVMAGNQPH